MSAAETPAPFPGVFHLTGGIDLIRQGFCIQVSSINCDGGSKLSGFLVKIRANSMKEIGPEKVRIGCVVVGFLSTVLSLVQLTFAQAQSPTQTAIPPAPTGPIRRYS